MTMTAANSQHGAALAKAATLIEALPWLERFSGQTVVIKFGGSAMTDDQLCAAFAQDVWPIQRDVCGFFCHSGIDAPDFVDILDADDSYAAMLQYPALLGDYSDNAPVATYSHLPASNAKVVTTLQLSVVRNWLRLERGD